MSTLNKTITLLRARLQKRGYKTDSISPAAEILCDVIDEKEQLWNYDRNSYNTRIKALEEEVHRLKTRGQAG